MIEPTTVEEAEAAVKRLMLLAYAPQPVVQPGGATLHLCWAGRLYRAYSLRNEAMAAGDDARAASLLAAIDKLSAMAHEAMSLAERADSTYHSLCILKNIEPHDWTPPQCECAACVDKNKRWRIAAAAGDVRKAAWALMGDAGEGQPPIITLFRAAAKDKSANDQLWRHLLSIVTAMEAYIEECSKAGEHPDWAKETLP